MRIAIIGAGMAGLSCGLRLRDGGHEISVFDKGRGPGGRMSTRRIEHGNETFQFDHGAQYFTARDPAFVARVAEWDCGGHVARWPAAKEDAWVGTPQMSARVRAMSETLGLRFNCRICRSANPICVPLCLVNGCEPKATAHRSTVRHH